MAVTLQAGDAAPRRVSILGSTGSIGCNTIDLLRRSPGAYVVEALTAHRNVELLASQALELQPAMAVIGDPSLYGTLKEALAGTNIAVGAGPDALVDAAGLPADWVMAAIVGAAGLAPTLAAVRRGVTVALANKECLVCAGPLMLAEIERSGATLLPVDSEHSAIFQVFDFDNVEAVDRVILTASGGPFLKLEMGAMAKVTPKQAVAHPNWDMGDKISIDSATMMNKGLEVIEASYLFPISEARIEVLIHPQSVIHSLVAYTDGSVLAQLGVPDMRTPIAYAMAWPRRQGSPAARLDLAEVGALTFEAPDMARFPALGLAREALKTGQAAPTVLNAANEIAVQGFLAGEIGFLDIMRVVTEVLERAPGGRIASIEDVTAVDGEARRVAAEVVASMGA
ncbi:MAG: 1-deoxy-D-xylulose-5-phosphate reductoisomerase [Alphaproteobacteria bacterium]|nr:1-deoxy-D-xylulose-5-phosphate reductoisomerase [Alphaproteobacteria bacterium]